MAGEEAALRAAATLVGFTAVLLWSLLASLTAFTRALPAFELLAVSFALGGLLGLVLLARRGGLAALKAVPAGAWALGVAGLFGYHFCYFMALRGAPACWAERNAFSTCRMSPSCR